MYLKGFDLKFFGLPAEILFYYESSIKTQPCYKLPGDVAKMLAAKWLTTVSWSILLANGPRLALDLGQSERTNEEIFQNSMC